MNPWQPTLTSARLVLRPITETDFEPLYAVASDPLLWEQHPDPLRWQRDRFAAFFRGAMECGGGLVAIAAATGELVGSSRYYDWDPTARTVVVGYTFLARAHWGTGLNPEMKRLMLEHAWSHVDTVYFHVGPNNVRSQRAMANVGARLEGTVEVTAVGITGPRLVFRIDAPHTDGTAR